MYEPSPFPKNMLRIVESKPARRTNSGTIRGICIDASPGSAKRPDLDGINALLDTIKAPAKIAVFQIGSDSALRELPSLKRFPNLTHVHIAAGKVGAYDELHALKKVTDLFVVNFKGGTLHPFEKWKLNYLRLIRGQFTTLAMNANVAMLQGCSKLERFTGGRIEHLTLEACNRLDLNSLGRIKNLAVLELVADKSLANFGFVRACRNLEDLTVAATRNADLSALFTTRTLKRVFLSARDSVIRDVGGRNHRLIVSNGDVCIARGEAAQHWDHWPE